jgi:HAD superfamily hydrolase (TIGR01459 family)
MTNAIHPPRVSGLSDIVHGYRFLLCDAWGVLHNGVRAYPAAVDALTRARGAGLTVFVLTNAPRPKSEVLKQFERFGVDAAAFDDIVTSGEAAREHLAGLGGARAHYVGPERDRVLLDGLGLTLTADSEAELIACTGLFDDDRETPDDYAARMTGWVARGLTFVCANPDKVVERGDRLLWCAGALAQQYEPVRCPCGPARGPGGGAGDRRCGGDRPPRRRRCRAGRAVRHRGDTRGALRPAGGAGRDEGRRIPRRA